MYNLFSYDQGHDSGAGFEFKRSFPYDIIISIHKKCHDIKVLPRLKDIEIRDLCRRLVIIIYIDLSIA